MNRSKCHIYVLDNSLIIRIYWVFSYKIFYAAARSINIICIFLLYKYMQNYSLQLSWAITLCILIAL